MAPTECTSLTPITTRTGTVYTTGTSNDEWEGSICYWSVRTQTYSNVSVYPSSEMEKKIKKLMKKMRDKMCKTGWIKHIPYYLQPKLEPINLRSVRLYGRGWANL